MENDRLPFAPFFLPMTLIKKIMKLYFGMISIVFATVCFGMGIYLIPATMWRAFCVAFLIIALILLVVGIILIRKNKK